MQTTQVVSFNCTLKNTTGEFISSAVNRNFIAKLDSSGESSLPGLTRHLYDLKKGDKKEFTLIAEEAYGSYDSAKVILYPRKKLSKSARTGDSVKIVSKTGVTREYTILEMKSDFVNLDGNHPLAGQDLCFEIEGLDSRKPTVKELSASTNFIVKF